MIQVKSMQISRIDEELVEVKQFRNLFHVLSRDENSTCMVRTTKKYSQKKKLKSLLTKNMKYSKKSEKFYLSLYTPFAEPKKT